MPEYLAPGVYVEETVSASAPIAGVSTSIAGFIGKVADDVKMPEQPGKFEDETGSNGDDTGGTGAEEGGAAGGGAAGGGAAGGGAGEGGATEKKPLRYEVANECEPKLITSWSEFKISFGDIQEGNKVLAHAVYGYFNNGGSLCWVARVKDGTAPTQIEKVLEEFKTIDEITMVVVPGAVNTTIQEKVMSHCENAGDRFAILDGQQTTTFTDDAIKKGLRDSDYAALYFPWISVYDPIENKEIFVPPSGHIAGIYARVDSTRGVHKAPANEVIRGAKGVESRLSRDHQKLLNPNGVNVIRKFNGNITVWGARTLAGDKKPEWTYISVRRLFLYLRESIDEGTQWVVFEPNDPQLWAKIRLNVSAFLTGEWRKGALFGATPDEAFFVKCDADTNPQDVRDQGQVITEIGVAVVKPAEFVIFRISQTTEAGG